MRAAKRDDMAPRREATRTGARPGEADGAIADARPAGIVRPVEDE